MILPFSSTISCLVANSSAPLSARSGLSALFWLTHHVYHIVALLELVSVIASSKIYCLSYLLLHLSIDSLWTWTLSSLSHWFCRVNTSGALLFQRLRFLSMACALTQLLEVYFLSPYLQFLMWRYMISSWPYFYGFKYKFGFNMHSSTNCHSPCFISCTFQEF